MEKFDKNPFDVLGGLPTDAREEEINKAYKILVQLYHPDKNPDRLEWATENMRRLNEAREILTDPVKRAQCSSAQQKVQTVQRSNRVLRFRCRTCGIRIYSNGYR